MTLPEPPQEVLLWLALRHGSVTIQAEQTAKDDMLWLALRHGSVTIYFQLAAASLSDGDCLNKAQPPFRTSTIR